MMKIKSIKCRYSGCLKLTASKGGYCPKHELMGPVRYDPREELAIMQTLTQGKAELMNDNRGIRGGQNHIKSMSKNRAVKDSHMLAKCEGGGVGQKIRTGGQKSLSGDG